MTLYVTYLGVLTEPGLVAYVIGVLTEPGLVAYVIGEERYMTYLGVLTEPGLVAYVIGEERSISEDIGCMLPGELVTPPRAGVTGLWKSINLTCFHSSNNITGYVTHLGMCHVTAYVTVYVTR